MTDRESAAIACLIEAGERRRRYLTAAAVMPGANSDRLRRELERVETSMKVAREMIKRDVV